jgi:5-methylcytosine-specific restriction endonuclease McrA
MRHAIPNGDPALIVERGLKLLVEHLERTRSAQTSRPRPANEARPGSRHVPAAVKRAVWARDQGQCAFEGKDGRCPERGFLEIHHVVPFVVEGETAVENLELRCRAHNAYEAEQFFGPLTVKEVPAQYSVWTELQRADTS